MFFKKFWTQVSSAASLKDVKRRVLDNLKSAGFDLTIEDIRLWLYTEQETEVG